MTEYQYWNLPNGDRLHRWRGVKLFGHDGEVEQYGLSGNYDNLIELDAAGFEAHAATTESEARRGE